jgi:hypothetical protein
LPAVKMHFVISFQWKRPPWHWKMCPRWKDPFCLNFVGLTLKGTAWRLKFREKKLLR